MEKGKLFWFFRVGLCAGQNQMCHLCGWLKLLGCLICLLSVLVNRFAYLFLKNVRWEKIKIQKRWLLGRLSDCSLFLSLFSVSFCRSFLIGSFFRLAGNVFGLGEGGDFLAQMLMRRTKL
jgi:hypothetical protein